MKKHIALKSKSNPSPFNWKAIRSVRIKSHAPGCDLTAEEFVKRIKTNPGYYDDDLILARSILMQLCKLGTRSETRIARIILERCGYDKTVIPEEAYAPARHRTEDPVYRAWQTHPESIIRIVELETPRIEPLFKGKKKDDSDAIRKAFRLLVRKDITPEEMKTLNRRQAHRSITDLILFMWVCIMNSAAKKAGLPPLSFDSIRSLYYKHKKERYEIKSKGILTWTSRELEAGNVVILGGFYGLKTTT